MNGHALPTLDLDAVHCVNLPALRNRDVSAGAVVPMPSGMTSFANPPAANWYGSLQGSDDASRMIIPGAPAAGGISMEDRVNLVNRWREFINPLRGITIDQLIAATEDYEKGWMANLQWLYKEVEKRNPTFLTAKLRRLSALEELECRVKIKEEFAKDPAAQKQQAFLQSKVDLIDNLDEAICHFALAIFRGYAHAEKHVDEVGDVIHLELLDQWHCVRDGRYGQWRYNPSAMYTSYLALGQSRDMNPAAWIFHTVEDHLDYALCMLYYTAAFNEKSWNCFLSLYGLPGAYITAGEKITPAAQTQYMDAIRKITQGGSGLLPQGTTVTPYVPWDGTPPFETRARFLKEEIVLLVTGGMLTMLNGPTGIGAGASTEHGDVFDELSAADAKRICRTLRRQLFDPMLDDQFPGQPHMAYFDICAHEETDSGALVTEVQALSSAGFDVSESQVTEKTGWEVEKKEPITPMITATTGGPNDDTTGKEVNGEPAGVGRNGGEPEVDTEGEAEGVPPGDARNRARAILFNASGPPTLEQTRRAQDLIAKALDVDLRPLRTQMESIMAIEDPEEMRSKLQSFRDSLPELYKAIAADPIAAHAMNHILTTAVEKGTQPND